MKTRHSENTVKQKQKKPQNNMTDELSDDTKEEIEKKQQDNTKEEIQVKKESDDIKEEIEGKDESDDSEEETEEKAESDVTEEEIEKKDEVPKKDFKYYVNRFRYYHYYYSEIIQDYIAVACLWIIKMQLYLMGVPLDKLTSLTSIEDNSIDNDEI